MRDFFEEVLLPFGLAAIITITLVLTVMGIVYGIKATIDSNECKVWGGKYRFSTGCLIEYNNKTLTLANYKTIQMVETTRPIEHNVKIKGE